mgnify:CR=1 FL=1
MSSPTDDVSGIEDEDLIGVADRRDPLGDDEHRGVAMIGFEGALSRESVATSRALEASSKM